MVFFKCRLMDGEVEFDGDGSPHVKLRFKEPNGIF